MLNTSGCCANTVEPLSKGHFGTSHFVPSREAVLFSEVEMYCMHAYTLLGKLEVSLVVRSSLSTLLEVLLKPLPFY